MEIRGADARRLNIKTLSQAAAFAPQWHAGFGYEFMERPTGMPDSLRVWPATLPDAARDGFGLLAPGAEGSSDRYRRGQRHGWPDSGV